MSDFANDPISPSAATPAETPAPAPQGAPASPVATPQAPHAGATPGPGDGWVPSYRVRETREAAIREANSQRAAVEAQWQAKYDAIQSQLHALVGVQAPANPEIQEVRKQFGGLYPGLSKLEEKAAQLEAMLERAGDLEAQTEHYWNTYGRQTLDNLFTKAAGITGGTLNQEAKEFLHTAFSGYVQSSPERTARYANDPTIVDDFLKVFSSNLIDPVRRSANVDTLNRAPGALPQDSPGGAPRSTPAPTLSGLDERTSAAWANYQANARPQR